VRFIAKQNLIYFNDDEVTEYLTRSPSDFARSKMFAVNTYTIRYNNTASVLPSTNDRWPRTILVYAEGLLTKIKKIKFAPKTRVSVTAVGS